MQWEIQSDMTITSKKFKVILFTVVIVQFIFVFFWMNKNDSEFFELLALESPKNIEFIIKPNTGRAAEKPPTYSLWGSCRVPLLNVINVGVQVIVYTAV